MLVYLGFLYYIAKYFNFSGEMNEDLRVLYSRIEETDEPIAKVKLMGELALRFTHNDLDRCISVTDEMIEIAEPIAYMEGLADAYHAKARVSARTMKYDEAIEQFQQALGYLENSEDLVLKAKMYDGLGVVYSHTGKFEKSISSSQKAIELYTEAEEPMGLKANGYNNIGNSYARMGNLLKAEEYFTKALELVVERGNIHRTPNLRVNLAIIKGLKGEKKQAVVELTQCLKEYEASRHKAGIAETNMNIAHIHRSENNYADSIRHYLKSIVVLKQIGNKQSLAEAYVGLAKVYLSLGGNKEALEQISLSEKIYATIHHPNGKIEMLKTKAAVLKNMNEQTEADTLLKEVDAYAIEYGINHSALNF